MQPVEGLEQLRPYVRADAAAENAIAFRTMAPPVVPIALGVDLGIGQIVEAAEKHAARRERRKNDAWGELKDDVEAIADIVSMTDELYIRLLEGIQGHARATDNNPDDRGVLIEEVRHFIHDERIPQLLTNLNSRVAAVSRYRKMKWPKYRKLANSLRSLERASDAYLEYLREIHNGKVPRDSNKVPLWNLASVLAQLESGEGELSLFDYCEEAIRNRRLDLPYAVNGMAGQSTTDIRMLKS
jgi:hypothetical protein